MSPKNKTVWAAMGLMVAILLGIALLTNPAPAEPNEKSGQAKDATAQNSSSAPPGTSEPPALPAFQTTEKRFEVLAVRQDGTYRVRVMGASQETDLFIPADANVTAGSRGDIGAGTILTVERYLDAANGIVATELSIATAL